MEIVKIFNTGDLDGEEYENASGRRGRRVRRSRKGGMRSGLGRKGGRPSGRKRTGLNRAIGVIPIVAGARYLQRRRAEREEDERKYQSSKSSSRKSSRSKNSRPKYSRSNNDDYQGKYSTGKVVGEMQFPKPLSQSRPPRGGMVQIGNNSPIITTDPLQGKPNAMPQIEPTPNNNNVKIALIVGGVLLLGVAAYFYSKRNK